MEIEDLSKVVVGFILVGLLLGIGILTFDKFGTAIRESTTVTKEVTLQFNTNVSLGIYDVQSNASAVTLVNGTDLYGRTGNYSVYYSSGGLGYIQLREGCCYNATAANVTVYYLNKPRAFEAMSNMSSTTGTIPSTWLPLLITVVVLSIILVMVIRGFTANQR